MVLLPIVNVFSPRPPYFTLVGSLFFHESPSSTKLISYFLTSVTPKGE